METLFEDYSFRKPPTSLDRDESKSKWGRFLSESQVITPTKAGLSNAIGHVFPMELQKLQGVEAGQHGDNKTMGPPLYADLGKSGRDIFSKGYPYGLIKLDLNTKTGAGVEFNSGGVSNQETGKVFGTLETKYKLSDYGLTFSERWNTDNTLATEVAVQDQLAKGLKLAVDCSFAPLTGVKSGHLKTEYKHDKVAINSEMDLALHGPLVKTAIVVGHQGWLAGYQTALDTEKGKLTKNNFALGFTSGDFVLHTNVDDGQEFGGSVYQKVSPQLETGISLAWSSGSNNTRFGIGCKYNLEAGAALRAKVNNQSQVGLGYEQKLRDGVTVELAALIDGNNLNSGGHKIGVSFEISVT